MKVGSLVMLKSSQHLGIVTKIYIDDVRIYWIKSGNFRLWGKHSVMLEVICE